MDIIAAGFAGYDGSCDMYGDGNFRRKLFEVYKESFFDVLKNRNIYSHTFSVGNTAAYTSGIENIFRKNGCIYYECAANGGVLSALWRLLKKSGNGGEFSLRKIPVLQQTVELCTVAGINPYRLNAASAYMVLSENTGMLISMLCDYGVPAALIGHTMPGKAIIRTDNENNEYLRKAD